MISQELALRACMIPGVFKDLTKTETHFNDARRGNWESKHAVCFPGFPVYLFSGGCLVVRELCCAGFDTGTVWVCVIKLLMARMDQRHRVIGCFYVSDVNAKHNDQILVIGNHVHKLCVPTMPNVSEIQGSPFPNWFSVLVNYISSLHEFYQAFHPWSCHVLPPCTKMSSREPDWDSFERFDPRKTACAVCVSR